MLTQSEATRMAKQMMAEHGLTAKGWTFKLNTNRSRLGVCKYGKVMRNRFTGQVIVTHPIQRIEISIYCIQAGLDTFRNTMLHEIAHALVGPGHNHNAIWKAKARAIGCTGDRCGKMDAPAKYIGECPKCKGVVKRNRNVKGMTMMTHTSCGASPYRGEFIRWNHLRHNTTPINPNPRLFVDMPSKEVTLRSMSNLFPEKMFSNP